MTTHPGEHAASPTPGRRGLSNLAQRLLTGIIALPIVLWTAYSGGWWFVALAAPLAAVGVIEFCMLGRSRYVEGNPLIGAIMAISVVLGVHLRAPILWAGILVVGGAAVFMSEELKAREGTSRAVARTLLTLGGVAYVAFPAAMMVAVRNLLDGLTWLLLIFFMTWGTDSFAYIAGRLWGHTPLAPTISPKKTREGAIGGVICGVLAGAIFLALNGLLSPLTLPLVLIGPPLAIVGDLAESAIKRWFEVKDSHLIGFDILPGHGGVLDRIDGLILVTVFTFLYMALTGLA
jgi:phosphatidate cytidylyltransferase